MLQPLLTPTQVAALRGMTVKALAVERCRGKGPRYIQDTNGKRVRYDAADLQAYFDACRINPADRKPVTTVAEPVTQPRVRQSTRGTRRGSR